MVRSGSATAMNHGAGSSEYPSSAKYSLDRSASVGMTMTTSTPLISLNDNISRNTLLHAGHPVERKNSTVLSPRSFAKETGLPNNSSPYNPGAGVPHQSPPSGSFTTQCTRH